MAMLALKPPMGWNAWNFFGYRDTNEKAVMETADAMVKFGFRDAVIPLFP
jgi:alpha-galactosidase